MRGRWGLLLLASLGVAGGSALAEPLPRTPSVRVEGSATLAQVGEGGRIRFSYDLRALGAAGVRVELDRCVRGASPGGGGELSRSLLFLGPVGQPVVRPAGLSIGIYRVTAVALGPDGQAVGGPSIPVWLEVGGLRAWDELTAHPPPTIPAGPGAEGAPWAGIAPVHGSPEVQGTLSIRPETAALQAGGRLKLQAEGVGLPDRVELEWDLEGEGEIEGEGFEAVYAAPEGDGPRLVRIRVRVRGILGLEGQAHLLVTPAPRVEPGRPSLPGPGL